VELKAVKLATEAAYLRDWRSVPILECGEPLVRVEADEARSWYHEVMALTTDPHVYLRETVYGMFAVAREIVKEVGFDLKVYDGWRPVALQEQLFWYYLQSFSAPDLGLKEFELCQTLGEVEQTFLGLPDDIRDCLKEANRRYVSWPSSDAAQPSPHATGGAIDVWLSRDGEPADLGVDFDWMEENAGVFYHLGGSPKWQSSGDPATIRFNRELLIRAMVTAGFSCYPHEIWHFNFGNQMDALVSGEPARYGYIEP
jgi:D-alanyl-D-alanine dipeptidase